MLCCVETCSSEAHYHAERWGDYEPALGYDLCRSCAYECATDGWPVTDADGEEWDPNSEDDDDDSRLDNHSASP